MQVHNIKNLNSVPLYDTFWCCAQLSCMRTGFLHVLFLAGATASPIQQHCAIEHELYTLLLPPCSCYSGEYSSTFNIMWVRVGDAPLGSYNHIVPLLPSGDLTPQLTK